jgi:hypothetical protein
MQQQHTNPLCRDLAGARSLLDDGSNSGSAGQGGNSTGKPFVSGCIMHATCAPYPHIRCWQHQQQLTPNTLAWVAATCMDS